MQPDLMVHLAWFVLRLQPGGICYWLAIGAQLNVPTEESSMISVLVRLLRVFAYYLIDQSYLLGMLPGSELSSVDC